MPDVAEEERRREFRAFRGLKPAADTLVAPYAGTGDPWGAALSNVISARGGDKSVWWNPLSYLDDDRKVSPDEQKATAEMIQQKTGITDPQKIANLDHYMQGRMGVERGGVLGALTTGAANLIYTGAKGAKQAILGRKEGESKASWGQLGAAFQGIGDQMREEHPNLFGRKPGT